MYKFNYVMYMILTIIFGSSMVCACLTPALICSACLFCCTGVPLIACYILTGIRLLGGVGSDCAANKLIYNTEENFSFEADAELVKSLWITQIVMHIPMACFWGCGF